VPKAKVVPALSSGTITLTKQASKLTPAIATIPVGGLDTGFITTPTMGGGLPFAVPLFTLGAPFKFGGVKKFKGKRKFAYTPSYKAFVFGIQSKAKTPISTKKWTGLETRPFTKGFSFFKIRSLLKKKKEIKKIKYITIQKLLKRRRRKREIDYMKKGLLFISFVLCLILLLGSVSAFTFDNVKQYDNVTREITIKNV